MSIIVPAFQGETLDALVWRETGKGSGAVERVLDANPGLAAIAASLPEGHPVTIPTLPSTVSEIQLLQLWD